MSRTLAAGTTVREALRLGTKRLTPVADDAHLEASVLLADALQVKKAWLYAHDDACLDADQAAVLDRALRRRGGGVPLPYVLGWWEFYGRRFSVGPEVLIPRPETELLVELGLEHLWVLSGSARVLDMGTGSGCVGITLAAEYPSAGVLAVDRSRQALVLARLNGRLHQVDHRLRFVCADMGLGIQTRFDLVCANLPYIPTDELAQWESGPWEPQLALDGGQDGLQPIRRLMASLSHLLAPNGKALLELGAGQAGAALGLADRTLPGWPARTHKDLSGIERVLEVCR
jgi:release factor glutamine methyltransferase